MMNETCMECGGVNWERWHDLLDIRDRCGLDSDEQDEYDRFAKVVEVLDHAEAVRCKAVLDLALRKASL